MDWNTLFNSLGTSVPVILVLGWGWMRAEKRADDLAAKRDDDNKSWADRYAELAHSLQPSPTMPVDIEKRLN